MLVFLFIDRVEYYNDEIIYYFCEVVGVVVFEKVV